jgi:hypothetical protein
MNDQEILDRAERAARSVLWPDDAYEGLLRRRDRKRRNQRVTAGVLGIALFAFAAIGFVKLLGSERGPVTHPAVPPSPTAAPRPSPAPGFSTFSSVLHGITIDYPAGWKVRPATEPWNHRTITFDAANVDVIFDPTLRDDLYLTMVSEPLEPGESDTEWVSDVWPNVQSVGICRGGAGGGGDDTLQGNYGWFWSCDEPHGASSSVWIVATATRGYIIYLYVGNEVPATYPVPDFEGAAVFGEAAARGEAPEVSGIGGPTGFLETLDLRPGDAVDALNPSESP